ncbi:organic solute transporter subunit alpha-like [Saccoglossus kowalevskii]|uniref:Organic solute transporter subunit alpha-like n=1 Tax=Saccoglossus kowalevskii TaxID=10224 RepID=A0ABM0M439_SACKO|nr:PREDICTED: organic solute transporter subunit alpha-like [Saccoglossus kowalevskii]
MTSNCSSGVPYTSELYAGLSTAQTAMYTLAPVLTAFTALLFFESVYYVRNNIPTKSRRNKIIWVLGIFPMFSITSLLGLLVPRSALVTTFAASVYFSVSMYQFTLLNIDYYGGRDAIILLMKDKDVKINVPPVMWCCVCLPAIKMTRKTQPWLRRLVLQVTLVNPTVLFISIVLWTDGLYVPGEVTLKDPIFWVSITSLASTLVAIQSLSMTFQASRKQLKDYKITHKYMAIQLSLIFSIIQLSILSLLSSTGVIPCTPQFNSLGAAYHLYNFMIVCEFFCLGIFARAFFRSRKMGNLEHVMDPERARAELDEAERCYEQNNIDNTVTMSSITGLEMCKTGHENPCYIEKSAKNNEDIDLSVTTIVFIQFYDCIEFFCLGIFARAFFRSHKMGNLEHVMDPERARAELDEAEKCYEQNNIDNTVTMSSITGLEMVRGDEQNSQ